jgi:SAM-dependent methyltransferase
MSPDSYPLAGQASELDRLQLQSRVWEPAGRRLLDEIGAGSGVRAVDVGCGSLGWLRPLSEWVGPDGEVVGTDIDEGMLAAAPRFVTSEGLGNVSLVKDDLFASELGLPARPNELPTLREPVLILPVSAPLSRHLATRSDGYSLTCIGRSD